MLLSKVLNTSHSWRLIGKLESCDPVPACLFNLSLFGPVRRSNRTTENSNQATQIALQLVTRACLSAFKVSEDNSIRADMRICCYLNQRETESVFCSRSVYFLTPSSRKKEKNSPYTSCEEKRFGRIRIQTTTSLPVLK